jgi:hypothetical protein
MSISCALYFVQVGLGGNFGLYLPDTKYFDFRCIPNVKIRYTSVLLDLDRSLDTRSVSTDRAELTWCLGQIPASAVSSPSREIKTARTHGVLHPWPALLWEVLNAILPSQREGFGRDGPD